MAHLCTGVSRAPESGAFYYDDNTLNEINVPVGHCKGTYILSEDELYKYFGVESKRMGPLPEVLIAPHLNSTWNSSRSDSQGRSWWDITGEVVAYKPIEWVPVVKDRRTIPFSHFRAESTKTTTNVTTSELFGSAEAAFTLSAGGGWSGMKMDLSTTTKVEASYRTSKTVDEEIVEKAKFGDVVIKELVMGMGLKVERIFERTVKLYLNDEKKTDSLNWEGPESWADLCVPASLLRDVASLQFRNIVMSGSGHSTSLQMQALPVFDATTKKITDLHLVFSNVAWTDWYVYPGGRKIRDSRRAETLPLPDTKPPVATFIPVTSGSSACK
jgi:hypothetical protein